MISRRLETIRIERRVSRALFVTECVLAGAVVIISLVKVFNVI